MVGKKEPEEGAWPGTASFLSGLKPKLAFLLALGGGSGLELPPSRKEFQGWEGSIAQPPIPRGT